MKKSKILWFSDSGLPPTGYGPTTKHIVKKLAKPGKNFGKCEKCGEVFVSEHQKKFHGLNQLHWCPAQMKTLDVIMFPLKCPQCGYEF